MGENSKFIILDSFYRYYSLLFLKFIKNMPNSFGKNVPSRVEPTALDEKMTLHTHLSLFRFT